MKKPVQIYRTNTHCYSDVYASREKAIYRIGRPDGSPMSCYNISLNEAKSILANLPSELVDYVKEYYGIEGKATDPEEKDVPLEDMSRSDLRQLCKDLEITGYGKWSKEEMIAAIEKVAFASDDE